MKLYADRELSGWISNIKDDLNENKLLIGD